MARRPVHVVPRRGKWAIRRANANRVTRIFETESEAIESARSLARAQKTEMYIHGQDGRIRERNSYGNDPFPPNG